MISGKNDRCLQLKQVCEVLFLGLHSVQNVFQILSLKFHPEIIDSIKKVKQTKIEISNRAKLKIKNQEIAIFKWKKRFIFDLEKTKLSLTIIMAQQTID